MKHKEKETAFDFDFLEKLVVGIGEVSEITGIPTRQIRYWEDKGIIKSLSENGKNRRYDYKNIKKKSAMPFTHSTFIHLK